MLLTVIFGGREPVRAHETSMIAKHETCIDFYGASERCIEIHPHWKNS